VPVVDVADDGEAGLGVDATPDLEGAVVAAAALNLNFGFVAVGDVGFPVLGEG
jgi:hypothetical protein